MMKLRINPFVVTDLKEICDYIAEDNAMRSIMRSGCVRGRLSENSDSYRMKKG